MNTGVVLALLTAALLVGLGLRLTFELWLRARQRRSVRAQTMAAQVRLQRLTFQTMQAMLGEVRRHQPGGRDAQ